MPILMEKELHKRVKSVEEIDKRVQSECDKIEELNSGNKEVIAAVKKIREAFK